jgi:signal transduction histidine kinase
MSFFLSLRETATGSMKLANDFISPYKVFLKIKLNALIEESIAHAFDRMKLKNISLFTDISEEMNCVFVDKDKVRTAIMNIIINSIEAIGDKKGEIHIATYKQGNRYELIIRDNGPGMSCETKNKIFYPFFTNKVNGLGLGLSNARAILNENLADVRVESTLGIGAFFIINFNPA